VAELCRKLRPNDSLWVIVLGHAHYDGHHAFLNLPGPDISDQEFGKLFGLVTCREQVFFITTPVSGFFVEPLSSERRVVIAATEADLEVNETLYHLDLADVLSQPPPAAELDQDRDGGLSLLDLYLIVARRVLQRYKAAGAIPTEHAQIDDNGDGRGTEVQWEYLERELGGRRDDSRLILRHPGRDGVLAATLGFDLVPVARQKGKQDADLH